MYVIKMTIKWWTKERTKRKARENPPKKQKTKSDAIVGSQILFVNSWSPPNGQRLYVVSCVDKVEHATLRAS